MSRPIRLLELRSVRGTGGGPEKTILLSALHHDRSVVQSTVCYIRDERDTVFHIHEKARSLGIDYADVTERNSFDWRVLPQLKAVVRQRGIDIVHAHDYKTDLLALALGAMTRAVPMTTLHGFAGDSRRELLYYRLDRAVVRFFPAVITVSEPLRQIALASGAKPERVHRVSNGIDPSAFRRDPALAASIRESVGFSRGTIVVGAVGRLEAEKRFDMLVQAAAELQPDVDVHVVIAGEGSLRAGLSALASSLGIGDRLHLLGHRADVLAVHHLFDIYAQTSVREGIPNAVLEAMAVGTPVVATNVGGTGEIITDGVHGLLFESGDVAGLVRAIRHIIADAPEAARRAASARQRIEDELSFAARLRRVEKIYVDLMRPQSGAGRT